ncbi:hypothetical protein [Zooshikella harenae]|uniref:Uncharacterized protein n=1 Tax=Zooshikella harenae TaxID=2827238 RepID=A0ABS5ZLG0_9GAMM|nr:hypothetical protein [Zooshikella harenae]MBU2714240.1 hypothetical protein [Zooshikella harenae]
MTKTMKEILGAEFFDKERKIPGTVVKTEREFRYISCDSNSTWKSLSALFKKVVREIDPPIATSGGVINEGCKISVPSGGCYFAVSYKGDIEGWRQQIEQGAKSLGLSVAKILQDKILLHDGSEYLLSECNIEFD